MYLIHWECVSSTFVVVLLHAFLVMFFVLCVMCNDVYILDNVHREWWSPTSTWAHGSWLRHWSVYYSACCRQFHCNRAGDYSNLLKRCWSCSLPTAMVEFRRFSLWKRLWALQPSFGRPVMLSLPFTQIRKVCWARLTVPLSFCIAPLVALSRHLQFA